MNKLDVRSRDALVLFLETPDHDWSLVNVLGLDLRGPEIDDALLREEFGPRTSFLGCLMSGALARKIASSGALVVPGRPSLPFNPFPTTLYSSRGLLAGYDPQDSASYFETPDWVCYQAAMDKVAKRKRIDISLDEAVFFRLHDLCIESALAAYLQGASSGAPSPRRVVGIMGGHDRERAEKTLSGATVTDAPYMKVALLARRLSREGFTVATGGGPGAMEAANLGAWFAARGEEELRAAVRILARIPRVGPVAPGSIEWNSGAWLGPAIEVMEHFPRDVMDQHTESVGVPTWFYGHEPPNPFASHIAKFFENSLREEGILAIATHGVIFAEGNAGTVQEIFQDACQNYYSTYGTASPMILLGAEYWNRAATPDTSGPDKPLWPLLQKLAAERGFSSLLMLTDDLDAIVDFIKQAGEGVGERRRMADLALPR